MGSRIFLPLLLIFSSSFTAQLRGQEFVPDHYQTSDGALLLQLNDDYVEPYFATKALIVAEDGGLDTRRSGLLWIKWLLKRQRSDGRFERYCRKPGADWHACGSADADDSMLALWLQLLYRFAPDSGIPPAWQPSERKAQAQLAKLRNGRLGIYHVSERNHVALFMDNVEVYAALKDMAHAQARFRDQQQAEKTSSQAEKLASAIEHVFWDKRNRRFRSSMQKNQPAFYPDVVAQVFPWLAGWPASRKDTHAEWADWKSRFATGWLENEYDPHPWGLVALAAMKVGDESAAKCWLSHSEPLRYSQRWNILEESVFQGLKYTLQTETGQAADPRACLKTMGQP